LNARRVETQADKFLGLAGKALFRLGLRIPHERVVFSKLVHSMLVVDGPKGSYIDIAYRFPAVVGPIFIFGKISV
jgi:hypothetical protein